MKKKPKMDNSAIRSRLLKVLFIMKITTLFVFAFVMQISANVYSQKTRLQVDFKQASVLEVINEIEKKTGFTFFYSSDVLNTGQTISLSCKNLSLDEFLSKFCEQTGLKVEVVNKQILVKKDDSRSIPVPVPANQNKLITVKGKVSNTQGDAIPGASIVIKKTSKGITTDVDGNYSLVNVNPEDSISFSFIGMKTQKIAVKGRTTINVILEDESVGIEEVVAVGYGTQKKASIIGSITTVEPKKLISSNANLSNNLAGQLAGVLAVQRSGEPGSDQSDFWIRGVSTFNSGSQKALVLVDGVERSIDDVDPLDIESFSILKDATATAIYGVKGANGVILINTKKGVTGKPKVQVRFESDLSAPVKLVDYVDGVKFMQLFNEASRNVGNGDLYTDEVISKTKTGADPDLYPNVDWMKEIFKDFANDQKVNLNVTGGGQFIRYYVSGGYLHQNGILRTDNMEDKKSKLRFDRFNFRSNIDIDLSKTTLFNLSLSGFYKEKGYPGYSLSNIFAYTSATTPISYPTIYSNGNYAHLYGSQWSPWLAANRSGYSMNEENQIESTISLQQSLDFITKGLKAKGLFAFDAYNNQISILQKTPTTYYATGRDSDGNLTFESIERTDYISLTSETNTSIRNTYIEAQLNYQRTFGGIHNVSGLLLYNQSSERDTPASDEISSLPYRNNGIAGRVTYNFDERYFVEGNFGYNGSENFAPGHRYGFFPSLALGWFVSQEPYYPEALKKYVTKLKLKGSCGLVGNDKISASRRFGYLTLLSTGASGYSWGVDGKSTWSGISVSEYGDENMSWENATKTNAGIELSLLNMIDLNVDYYWENRKDIYMRRNSIPATTGITNSPYGNVGKMTNHGIDISLIVNKAINKDLFISLNSSFTFARNKIKEMDEPETKYPYQMETGKRYGQIFGLLANGLYTSEDFNADGTLISGLSTPAFMSSVNPGDIKYVDYNNDGVINDYDQVAIGYSAIPEIVYGFGATIKYKKFDLGFLFQGVSHTSTMLGENSTFFYPCENSGIQGNIYANIDSRWTTDNPRQDVFWPRLYTGGTNSNNRQPSTWWLRDASFCRLKNIEVGYNMKINFSKNQISPARVYVRGTNLLTWSKSFKNLWDPELNSSDGMSYPVSKIIALGLDISF
jgi:TonB-linked SusC/RagA family outer membrane protein